MSKKHCKPVLAEKYWSNCFLRFTNMIKIELSKYNCPVCNQPLQHKINKNRHILYCAFGPCESKAADMGTEDTSEQKAYNILVERVEEEEENKIV